MEPLANVLGSIYFLCVGMVISVDWLWEHVLLLGVLVVGITAVRACVRACVRALF